VKGALEFLDGMFGESFITSPQIIKTKNQEESPKENIFLLVSTRPFGETSNSLVQYITVERRINPEIAARYLKEIHFSNRENGKKYFAAGFENLSGGYEIRNPFFKSSLGIKDMGLVSGKRAGEELYVFEGFMDFLSKLTLDAGYIFSADALILNSVSYFEKAVKFIHQKGYKNIVGFLDNDKAGGETTEKLKAEFGSLFNDKRSEYHGFKDLNELLKSKQQYSFNQMLK
jgi:hypothetical protein